MRTKLLFLLALSVLSLSVLSHPGKTDANGGHYSRANGIYHYHHGYEGHYHTNGVCPYDFDDKTDHSNHGSSGGSNAIGRPYVPEQIETANPEPENNTEQISHKEKYNETVPLIAIGAVLVLVVGGLFIKYDFEENDGTVTIFIFSFALLCGIGYMIIYHLSLIVVVSIIIILVLYIKKQIKKRAFVKKLHGQSIRQAAGVPEGIVFIYGLPTDNRDKVYGSFTVYHSGKGSCYHEKQGCCSARIPVHYFDIDKRLRPCSKCCTNNRSVPQWYTEYNALKKCAQNFGIEYDE